MSLQKRATIRTQDYSYHPIVNTPFTLGIALPRDYGKFRVKGELEVSLAKFNSKYIPSRKVIKNLIFIQFEFLLFQFLICSLEETGDFIQIGFIVNTTTQELQDANSIHPKIPWDISLLRCNNRIGIGVLQAYYHFQNVKAKKNIHQTVSNVSKEKFMEMVWNFIVLCLMNWHWIMLLMYLHWTNNYSAIE